MRNLLLVNLLLANQEQCISLDLGIYFGDNDSNNRGQLKYLHLENAKLQLFH